MDSILKQEIKLNEETVAKIIASETAKAMVQIPEFMENLVKQMLFYREPQRYLSDPKNPTMHEKLIQKYMQPILEEEVKNEAESYRPKLRVLVKKAFKSNVIDNKEFEDRFIKQLSGFSSRITFYIPSN